MITLIYTIYKDRKRRVVMIEELSFIAGIFILLFIFIILTQFWMKTANLIGEKIRMFFINIWKIIKE